MSEKDEQPASTRPSKVRLVEMRERYFRTADGRVVNLEEASAADFDAFIAQYLDLDEDVDRAEWPLMLRWRAVNFSVKNGQFLEFVDPPEKRNEAV